jgi:hypothetical protein
MRMMVAACAGLVTLSAVSMQAAPLSPTKVIAPELSVAAPTELVAQGCGYGYRRTRWQDQWGYWHWGRCVPKWWGTGTFLPQD